MTRCDVYELLSFLANLDIHEDLLISAKKINRLEDILRESGIRCDFSKQSFDVAAYEYPERFDVIEQFIKIKVQPKGSRKFVYFNSNKDIALKIEESWENVIKEF